MERFIIMATTFSSSGLHTQIIIIMIMTTVRTTTPTTVHLVGA